MTCAILSIGTELTRGELVNTNAAWLAAEMTDCGFEVLEQAVVDDNAGRIIAALTRLSSRVRVIVCTGGLGPTTDDLTTVAVAQALGVAMFRDDASFDFIRRRVEKAGRTMSETNAKQADFPVGADILVNPIGTAAGYGVVFGSSVAFFMPGVPTEMKRMFEEQVAPRVRPLASNTRYQIRLRTFGLPESVVGERLATVEGAFPGVTIGYRAHFPEIEVKILAHGDSLGHARALCERATEDVRSKLSDVIYGGGDDTFAGSFSQALRARGLTLAIAESCTGGLVGAMLTSEPGASDFLLLDAVVYANSAKTKLLGIEEELIRAHGAVSAEVAAAMAEGSRRVSGAGISLAITGVAGPGGGTEEKPVGTVYFAVAGHGDTTVHARTFLGNRVQIQTLAAYVGLKLVRRALL